MAALVCLGVRACLHTGWAWWARPPPPGVPPLGPAPVPACPTPRRPPPLLLPLLLLLLLQMLRAREQEIAKLGGDLAKTCSQVRIGLCVCVLCALCACAACDKW